MKVWIKLHILPSYCSSWPNVIFFLEIIPSSKDLIYRVKILTMNILFIYLTFYIEIVLWTFLLGMCRSKLLMGFWLWRVLIIPSTHWFFFLADLDGAIIRQGPVRV